MADVARYRRRFLDEWERAVLSRPDESEEPVASSLERDVVKGRIIDWIGTQNVLSGYKFSDENFDVKFREEVSSVLRDWDL